MFEGESCRNLLAPMRFKVDVQCAEAQMFAALPPVPGALAPYMPYVLLLTDPDHQTGHRQEVCRFGTRCKRAGCWCPGDNATCC